MSNPRVRSRLRTDSAVRPISYRWQGNGYSTIGVAGNRISLRDYSYIVDVVGTPKTQRVKPVLHRTIHYSGRLLQTFSADYGNLVKYENVLPWAPFQSGAFESDMLRVPYSVRVQAAGEAFTDFSSRFPNLLSGAEFAQGLLEFKALLPRLEKTISQTIASGYLKKKFGWDNLLSDLNILSRSISSIRERMEFLKRTYGIPTKLRFYKPNVYSNTPWSYYDELVRGQGMRFTQESYRCDFIATATLLQRLDHIDDTIGWLRAIVISLGLNNPLLSIWQTTRLSFVLDWFLNVSGHLERLATIQPAEPWDIFDISSTVVWTCRVRADQVNKDLYGGIPNQEFHLGTFVIKQYERLVGLPVDLSIFTPSTLTPDQLVLMSAMVAAK